MLQELSQTYFVRVCLVLVLFCVLVNGQGVVVIEGPQDRAVLSGQNSELTCYINTTQSASNHVVQWIGNSVRTGSGRPISVNGGVTINNTLNKYSISTQKPYSLLLQSTDMDDAGKYTCNNVLAGSAIGGLEPYLVVLDPASCPMSNVSTYNESDTITITWSVAYAGNRDDTQKPTIKWRLNGAIQTAITNETTPGVFISTFTKMADRADDQNELKCSFSVLNVQQNCSTRLNIQYTGDPLGHLGAGAIAGIVIAVLVVLILLVVLVLYFLKKRKPRPPQYDFTPVGKDDEQPTELAGSNVISTRRSFFDLADNEKKQFYDAINKVKENGKYDELVLYHVRAMRHRENNKAHRGPAFLPWHRQYLFALETEMRKAMDDQSLAIPYWDWGSEAGVKITNSKIWNHIGGNKTIADGPFANWKLRHSDVNNSTLVRDFSTSGRIPSKNAITHTLKEDLYDELPWNESSGSGFRNVLEGWSSKGEGMHNTIHVLIGGEMLLATSPNDPVFWLHHAYIDKLWWEWQNSKRQAKQTEPFYLPTQGADKGHNLDDPMFPWDGETLSTVVKVRDVLNTKQVGYTYDKPIHPTNQDTVTEHSDGVMNAKDMAKHFPNSPYANPNLHLG